MKSVTQHLSSWWLPLFLLAVALMLLFASWWIDGDAATGMEVIADIEGGPLAPSISGIVRFVPAPGGTDVIVEVTGLPQYEPATEGRPPIGPHGFHVHEYGDCTVGDPGNPFQAAGGHYNPTDQPHGNHAGDLPVLFSNHGVATMTVFTSAFRPEDVVGRSVIIHLNPNDYRSQPAGNAGPRIACGVIRGD